SGACRSSASIAAKPGQYRVETRMLVSAPFPFAPPVNQAVAMQVVDRGRLPPLVQANAACSVRDRLAAMVTDYNKATSAVAGCHCLDRHRLLYEAVRSPSSEKNPRAGPLPWSGVVSVSSLNAVSFDVRFMENFKNGIGLRKIPHLWPEMPGNDRSHSLAAIFGIISHFGQ